VSKPKRIPRPKPAQTTLICPNCEGIYDLTVLPGHNEIYFSCGCGATIRAVIEFDGYQDARLVQMSEEKVEA